MIERSRAQLRARSSFSCFRPDGRCPLRGASEQPVGKARRGRDRRWGAGLGGVDVKRAARRPLFSLKPDHSPEADGSPFLPLREPPIFPISTKWSRPCLARTVWPPLAPIR